MSYNPRSKGPNGLVWILRGQDLGVPTNGTLTNNQVLALTAIPTDVPMKVDVSVALTSGALTVNADTNSTGTYASADSTITISNTVEQLLSFETSASNPYACLSLTAGSGGCVIAKIKVEVKGMLPTGFNPVSNGVNFFGATYQTGVFTYGPADGPLKAL